MAAQQSGLERLVEGIRAREWRALGRGLSILEDGAPEAGALVARLYPSTGRAFVIGVTGPPGSGKSTLVRGLARSYRGTGRTVGIIAVDPTSPFTGGALLGDRVRMQDLATDRDVFIRSMATRGAMGGLAPTTRDAVDLLDAAGFDPILVETVGVGQDEVDVMRTVDAVAVVTVPGLGDEIQAIKAGIMEIADVFVVNKSDREGADRTAATGACLVPAARHARAPLLGVRRGACPGARRGGRVLRSDRAAGNRSLHGGGRDPGAGRGARGYCRRDGADEMKARLDHIGIAVGDLAAALAFYRDALGLQVEGSEEVGSQQVRAHFVPAGGPKLELLEGTAADSPIAKYVAKRGPGLHHITFQVDDLAAALVKLKARGVRLIDERPRPGAEGALVAFIHPSSAHGVLVELKQQP
jgi:LAO/AO transport system kinase